MKIILKTKSFKIKMTDYINKDNKWFMAKEICLEVGK